MSARQSSAPRRRRWGQVLLAQIAAVILGLFVVELLARGYFWLRNEPYDATATRREVQHLLDMERNFVPGQDGAARPVQDADVHARLTLHPYLGYELDYGCSFVDDEYQRLRAGKSANEFQIMIVGGSVAALFGQHEWNRNSLRDILAADPRFAGREIRFQNFGRGAYKEPQQVNFVVYLLGLGFHPDAVICIDGFNEVALGTANQLDGWHPTFPSATQWSQLSASGTNNREALDSVGEIRGAQRSLEAWGGRIAAWRLDWSCILGKPALHHMYQLRRVILDRSAAYAQILAADNDDSRRRGPRLDGDELEAVKASVECWKEASRSLSDICRARGILYFQFLQPTLLDVGSKPPTALETKRSGAIPPWNVGVRLGYPLLRAAGEELRLAGVEFVDASMLFEKHTEDIYYDPCHFAPAGNALLAEKIGAEMLRRIPRRQ